MTRISMEIVVSPHLATAEGNNQGIKCNLTMTFKHAVQDLPSGLNLANDWVDEAYLSKSLKWAPRIEPPSPAAAL